LRIFAHFVSRSVPRFEFWHWLCVRFHLPSPSRRLTHDLIIMAQGVMRAPITPGIMRDGTTLTFIVGISLSRRAGSAA
jgi:hypothetical protein